MTDRITITTRFNSDLITQSVGYGDGVDVVDMLFQRVVNLQDEGVRAALIKLGWTPPKEELCADPQEKARPDSQTPQS